MRSENLFGEDGSGERFECMRKPCHPLILLLAFAAIVNLAQAQQPATDAGPAFETASIRPSHVTPGCYSNLPPGGTHYAVTCLTLRSLIGLAWKLNLDNIQGGDARTLDTYYDITAATPDGQPWTYDTIPPMLRQLLVERFHVAAHMGTREVSGFALVVAKGGPKLKVSELDATKSGQKAGEPFQNVIFPGYLRGRGANLSIIASLLSSPAHATVVDKTGITGVFDIDLRFAAENGSDQNLPGLFTAVEEQLGLKLKPEKVTVGTLVIDHTDSSPTSN